MERDAFKDAFRGLESWARFSYKKQLREAIDAVRQELNKTVHLYVSRFPRDDYRTLARRLHISPAKLCEILRPFPHGRKPGRRVKPRTVQTKDSHVPRIAVSVSHYFEREDVELALKALDLCVIENKTSDAGEDSYQNLIHWLKRRKVSKALRVRAIDSIQRYEKLVRK